MKDLGITKGEWFWDGDPSNYDPEQEAPWLVAGDKAEKIVIYGEIKITNIKDAELIADAGNTAQKCGLLPSELLKQRDELIKALRQIYRYWSRDVNPDDMEDALWEMLDIAEAAIKSTEQ